MGIAEEAWGSAELGVFSSKLAEKCSIGPTTLLRFKNIALYIYPLCYYMQS